MPQPLPADEIEALLRMARESQYPPAERLSDDELGPGDVQHLRGQSRKYADASTTIPGSSNWPDNQIAPDALLRQAERQLAEAIVDSNHDTGVGLTSHSKPVADRTHPRPGTTPQHGLTLDDLGDLDLDITIELGRSEILIEDVLKLREGSVVSLDKLAGDPVDIFANGCLVARGELLVIDGKFGVRLSEVL
jgi:flagellar motor switch protein FliN